MYQLNGELQGNGLPEHNFHPGIKFLAKAISVIFHPLFIPVYISWFLMYNTPVFPGFPASEKLMLLLRFFVMYTVFPLVTILLAKALGFIQSILLKTQKDRIIPYIACGLYYFWMWYVLRNQPEFPEELVMLALSIFIASSVGLIFNSYLKVSMHGISIGVMLAFIYIIALFSQANYGFYLSIALLVGGIVCTARLINSDHNSREVYTGLFIGIVSQIISYLIVF